MSSLPKIFNLASVTMHRPKEGLERIRNFVEGRRRVVHDPVPYLPQDLSTAIATLERATSLSIQCHLHDADLGTLETTAQHTFASLQGSLPFDASHNGDRNLARTCFALVRALQPAVAVETGVCYGFTTTYLLHALRKNRSGALHSIDLPPLARGADRFVGSVIPTHVRDRWTLHRGDARTLLPPLLHSLGEIDFFLHDSLHTCQHMRFEFERAWASMRPGGFLVSDDIEGNPAFLEHMARPDVRCAVVVKFSEGDALFGIAVKQ